ncbi:phosphate ABC transporter, permease domain protein, partial [Vibrio parahaemolyticus V-223/04]
KNLMTQKRCATRLILWSSTN